MGAQGAVGARGWRDTRGVGATVPALPAALRGGWRCRARRPTAWQGIGSARPGRQDRLDARSIPDASHWLEREAFPRAHSRAAWVSVGLHLDQNTAAYREPRIPHVTRLYNTKTDGPVPLEQA